jgi:hypothetical protein
MADTNVTGRNSRELTKYRITFVAALAALALAGWMIQTTYGQHIKVLQIGDQTGERLQMRGLIQNPEGGQHEQR